MKRKIVDVDKKQENKTGKFNLKEDDYAVCPKPIKSGEFSLVCHGFFFNKKYELYLMSMDKLPDSLQGIPSLVNVQNNIHQWGRTELGWKFTELNNVDNSIVLKLWQDEWKSQEKVLITPSDKIFLTLNKGHTLTTTENVAVKQIRNVAAEKAAEVEANCLKEHHFLKELTGHQNIIFYYGYYSFKDDKGNLNFDFVMKCAMRGDLENYINKSSDTYDTYVSSTHSLMHGIAQGLTFIHKMNIIHCDLKPANILLDFENGKLQAKIADFGISLRVGETYTFHPIPNERRAPEIIGITAEENTISLSSDVYTMSVVFLEIMAKITIEKLVLSINSKWDNLPSPKTAKLYKEFTRQKLDKKLDSFSKKMVHLITWGFSTNPLARPKSSEIEEVLRTNLNITIPEEQNEHDIIKCKHAITYPDHFWAPKGMIVAGNLPSKPSDVNECAHPDHFVGKNIL